MSERHNLWAVYTTIDWYGNETKYSAVLAAFPSFDEAIEAWDIARKRADRRKVIDLRSNQYAGLVEGRQRLEYLAVRSELDVAFAAKHRIGAPGRWSALLAKEGSVVRVVIYGNSYHGTVTKMAGLSGEVRFNTNDGPRVRAFPLLPTSPFARGIQSVTVR